jgi:hypothetical protein
MHLADNCLLCCRILNSCNFQTAIFSRLPNYRTVGELPKVLPDRPSPTFREVRQTLPFAAPGSRDQQCIRGNLVHIAHERSAPTVATLSRRKCTSGQFSPYCHTTEPCQSVQCEALRRVLRKCSADPHAAHHQTTPLLVASKTGCLGVLRVPSYSLRRRSPVLLGFPGLRRPVGVHLAPIGGLHVQLHTGSCRERTVAVTLLLRSVETRPRYHWCAKRAE